MNKENLKLLADYLLQLPEDYKHFDMEFFSDEEEYFPCKIQYTHCSTSACAVGHAPYVEGLPKPEVDESWVGYSVRIFGLVSSSYEWEWCFSGEWADADNTPHGAAKRILWLLEHGLPEDFHEQLYGDSPLCYTGEHSCT